MEKLKAQGYHVDKKNICLPHGKIENSGLPHGISQKNLWSNFYYYGNDKIQIMKMYTAIHSHYDYIVPLAKWAVKETWKKKNQMAMKTLVTSIYAHT